jgi:putative transposase
MKKSRFTESQIAFALKQAETGTKVDEICRQMGASEATFFTWNRAGELQKNIMVWGSQSFVSFDSLKRKILC